MAAYGKKAHQGEKTVRAQAWNAARWFGQESDEQEASDRDRPFGSAEARSEGTQEAHFEEEVTEAIRSGR
jgi:hypothetical protein